MMWQVQEAKQKFSEVLRLVSTEGDQIVTRHGEEVAVIIDIEELRRLRRAAERPARRHSGLFPPLEDAEFSELLDTVTAQRASGMLPSARTIPAFGE